MSFLDQIVDLLPLAAVKPLISPERNIVLIPASPPATRFGAALHDSAGPPGGGSPPQRVLAVLGPGATFAGIADTLLPLYAMASINGAPAALTRDELARAIVGYAKDYLAADKGWQFHTVGVLLPLPIEIDPGSKAWVIDASIVRTLALTFNAGWRKRLSIPPGALPVPDALDIEAGAASLVKGTAAAPLVQQLLTESMRNPSQQVLEFLAVLRVLDGIGGGPGVPGQAATGVLAAVTGTTPDQLSVLAATTAGNGLLRRFAALLSTSPPGADPTLLGQARTSLANALRPGGTPVVPQDVPETAGQLGGIHRLVLGRDVAVGPSEPERLDGVRYTGPAFAGQVDLHAYLKADAANLNPAANPDMPSLLVLLDGRPSGGRLDSVRARGGDLVTAGLDHWGATDGTGLPALLFAYKNAAPDEFDLFFAVHNLDVRPGPAGGPAFQFRIIGSDGSSTVPDAATLRDFFGATTDAQGAVTFSSDWAARFRLPALVSAAYRRAQVAQATAGLAGAVDPLALIVASVPPFPATVYPPVSDTSNDLKTNLSRTMNSVILQAARLGAHDADTLTAAVVNLAGAAPAYAGFRDDDTFYAASLAKIMPMYAAYELKSRIQQVMGKVRAAGLTPDPLTVFQVIRDVWGPLVCRVFPDFPKLDVRNPGRFPALKDMFTIGADGTVSFIKGPVTPEAFAAARGAPVAGTLFLDWMRGMILWSDDAAAGRTISKIQYPYINGLLRAGGFYDQKTQRGLWISGNYASADWQPGTDVMTLSDRGTQHYKSTTNFVANARQVAQLLALAARGQLLAGDAATRKALCDEMILLMQKDWIVTRTPTIVRDGPNISGGPGTDTFFGSAIGLAHGDTISSKIGIGNAQPRTNRVGIHDCAIVNRTVAADTFRYVAVVLGGFQDGIEAGAWDSAATAADAAIRS